jgi:protein AroM
LVTIGQSPRDDIVPGMLAHLGSHVEVLQAGALDGLTRCQAEALAPGPGDYVLISRMADGTSVTLARRHVVPRLAAAVAALEDQGCEVTAALCTGTFPDLETRRVFIEPERLFHAACAGIAGRLRLGSLIPLAAQVPQATARWRELGLDVEVRAASPYGPLEAVTAGARSLREAGVALVALDCFGFTEQHRELVGLEAGCPVILANTYLARVLGELLASRGA